MSIFNCRFSNRSAYLAIRDEEDRIRLFHAFVAKQQDRSSVDKDKASSSRKKNKRDKEKRDHERERDREDGKNSDKKKRSGSPVPEELSKG